MRLARCEYNVVQTLSSLCFLPPRRNQPCPLMILSSQPRAHPDALRIAFGPSPQHDTMRIVTIPSIARPVMADTATPRACVRVCVYGAFCLFWRETGPTPGSPGREAVGESDGVQARGAGHGGLGTGGARSGKPQTLIYAGCFVPYLTLTRAIRHTPGILLWRLETLLPVCFLFWLCGCYVGCIFCVYVHLGGGNGTTSAWRSRSPRISLVFFRLYSAPSSSSEPILHDIPDSVFRRGPPTRREPCFGERRLSRLCGRLPNFNAASHE